MSWAIVSSTERWQRWLLHKSFGPTAKAAAPVHHQCYDLFMKHAELIAIVHNVADSLASGMGFMIGIYQTDVYAEAANSKGGRLTVDFRNGLVLEGDATQALKDAVALYKGAFQDLLESAGGSLSDLTEASACYRADALERHLTVMVTDSRGRRSSTEYRGYTSKRAEVRDLLGRRRPKPSVVTRG